MADSGPLDCLRRFGQWIWPYAGGGRDRGLHVLTHGAGPAPHFGIEALEPRALLSAAWDVALIDRNLPNVSILERAMLPGGRVITYDGRSESPNEVLDRVIDWARESGSRIQSLSLLAHAAPGRFALGNEWVTRATLPETAKAWEALGRVMAEGGSINLYGCSLADPHGDGKALIRRIAYLAKAAVFASTDVTGRGGDWVLEAAARAPGRSGVPWVPGAPGAPGVPAAVFNSAALVSYPDSLGALSGSVSSSTAAVNFSAPSVLDWLHGGAGFFFSVDRKSGGGSQISSYSITGGGAYSTYSNDARPISWTDGSPNSTHAETAGNGTGVMVTGSGGAGFSITVPADTVTRQLNLYVGARSAAVCDLTAHLSDSSAPDYTDSVNFAAAGDRTYTINYSAASANQTLTVSWELDSSTPSNSQLTISGASLINQVPTVAVAAAASPDLVTGTTTSLSVLGADDGGEANLTYTWSTTGAPPAAVNFSANGTNAAKNTTATFTKAGTYNFLVTVTDAGGLSTTSSVSVTVSPALTAVGVTPASASLNENVAEQFSATAYDQFGSALASQPSFAWSCSGVGSVGAAGLYTAAGSGGAGGATVAATFGGVSGSSPVTVTDAAPSVATAAASAGPVTGTTTALSVLGADDGGEANLTYTWGTTGTPPAPVAFSANGTNAAKDATATFSQAGTYNLLVTIADAEGLTATSAVTVTVGQTLTWIQVGPASAALNENATQPFAATAYDQFAAPLASQPPFTWSNTGVGSVAASGLYTAPGSGGAGGASVTATSAGVSGSAPLTVGDAAPTVAAIASATPNPVTARTASLSVLGTDDGGESNLTYTWSTTGAPPAPVAFSANGNNAAKSTTATFAGAGTYDFHVTVADAEGSTVTSAVTVTVGQTLTTIGVSPAPASLVENGTQQFAATAYDQFGAPLASQPGFAWSNTGVGSVDATGLYTAPGSDGAGAAVTATAAGVSGSAPVNVSDAAPTVAAAASAPSDPVPGTATALSVLGADDGGEPNLAYTWSTTGTPPSAVTFSANGTNAAKNTIATFTRAGSYNLLVLVDDAEGLAVTSAVTVTVGQTLTTIGVTPAQASLDENATRQFAATAYDQFGDPLASQPSFTWSNSGVGSVDASGLYAAPGSGGSGGATVTATSGGVSGSAPVTVSNAAPTITTGASASPGPVTGTVASLSVLGADDGGEADLTYTWSTTGTPPAPVTFGNNGTNAAQRTTAAFSRAGSYSLLVTVADAEGSAVTSAVSVTVDQTLSSIAVTPASALMNENATQRFSAIGYDQFGVALAGQPSFAWSNTGAGFVDASGLYTAPGSNAAGNATVAATSGGVSGSAPVTVINAPPTVAVAATASPNPVSGTTAALSVLGADDGGEANLTYTWSTAGSPPAPVAFSTNGASVAKDATATFTKAGTYSFLVTIADAEGLTAGSTVSVVVDQTFSSIEVSPAVASVNEGATQPFAATGYDQFGDALATQPAWAWSVPAGRGSVDASGSYSAPVAGPGGPATVTASASGLSGSASVTVNHLPPTAGDDQFSVGENGTLNAAAPGVLANDADPQRQGLRAQLVSGTADGSLTLNADGSFTYAPAAHFWGTDSFTYRASDGDATSNPATVTIDVRRSPGVGAAPAGGALALSTSQAGASDTLEVVLTSRPLADVTVPLASSDSSVATISRSSVTFTPGDWDVPQPVTVTGADDRVAAGDQPFSILLGPASSADGGYDGMTLLPVPGLNRQTDRAGLVVAPAAGLRTTADGGTAAFAVSLSSRPAADVTVSVAVSDANEAAASAASLTFAAGNWDVPQAVTLTGLANASGPDGGGDTPFEVRLAAKSGDPVYGALPGTTLSAVNFHADAAPIVGADAGDVSLTEGDPAAAVDPGLLVSDADNQDLQSATISFSSGYLQGQDTLTYTPDPAIAGRWDATTGTLSLAGDAPVADYQAALRSVSYSSTDASTQPAARTIRFEVTDGRLQSAPAFRQIDLAAPAGQLVNLVPGLQQIDQGAGLAFSYAGGNPIRVNALGATGPITVTLTSRKGTLSLSQTAGLTFGVGNGTGNITMQFTGTPADVNAAMDGLSFQPSPGFTGSTFLRLTAVGAKGGAVATQSRVEIDVRPPAASTPTAPGDSTTNPTTPVPIATPLPPGTTTSATTSPADMIGPRGGGQKPAARPPSATSSPAASAGPGGDDGGAESKGDPPPPRPSRADPKPPPTTPPPAPRPPKRTSVVAAPAPAETEIPATAVPKPDSTFWRQLNDVAREMDAQDRTEKLTVGSATGVTALLSIGYVIWAVRGASMAASFLATLPMWRWMDPLPVLESWESRKKKKEGEPDPADPEDDADEQRLRSLTDEID